MPHTPWKAELSCFSDAYYCTWAVYDQENHEVCRVFEGGEADARLIAQAPAMYELLKSLEWHDEELHYSICPVCEGMEHRQDCKLAAVLKAVEKE